jgi:hypothetical protein
VYQLVYSDDAVRQLLQIRPANVRVEVLQLISSLAENPFQSGKFQVRDSSSRNNEIAVVTGFAVTFWADHAVKELRIVDVSKLPRLQRD